MAALSAGLTGLRRLVPSIPSRAVRQHVGVMSDPVDRADVGEVAGGLRGLLCVIEGGEVTAGAGEVAQLKALLALDIVRDADG